MVSWCKRDNIRGSQPQADPSFVAPSPGPVRRSCRLAARMPRLGDVADPRDVEGESDSADTKTDEEYGPGEFCFRVCSILLPCELCRLSMGISFWGFHCCGFGAVLAGRS